MSSNAFAQPPPFTWEHVSWREPLPAFPPPEPLDRPALPTPARLKPAFDAPYTLSTHLFPAAYLRSTRPEPEPPLPHPNATKEERKQHWVDTQQLLKDLRTATDTDGYPRVLWNCANRYVKNGLNESNRTGVTLFVAHANGFPKEIWEPTLGHLLSSPAASIIDEVWTWEAVQHGDAGLVNAPSATALFDWRDNSRDIANFLLHFLPGEATGTTLPVHLHRIPPQQTDYRLKHGFHHRKIVAIGHSLGGATSSLAAAMFPQLFTSLILIDPIILRPWEKKHLTTIELMVKGALNRRDIWSSREEAYESFLKSPFFNVWDPTVLKLYVECAIHVTPGPHSQAKLKMSGMQEAVVFSETHSEYEIWDHLANLDARIPIRWIMPGMQRGTDVGGPGSAQYRVWLRAENATNTMIPGAGHLIPQEQPKLLAEDLQNHLLEQFAAYKRQRLTANL